MADLKNILGDDDYRTIIVECDRLLSSKGHDYTQGGRGQHGKLANFFRVAGRSGVTPMQVWGVYAGKHFDAIETYIRGGELASEPIQSRIVDAINYLLLLAKLIRYTDDEAVIGHAPGGG